jgi:hypothetical protein
VRLSLSSSTSSHRIGRSWFEQLRFFRFYILYMSVGVAAIPAGVLYGVLALKGYDRWWTALACVVIGLCCAIETSRVVRERLFPWQAIVGSLNLRVLGEDRIPLELVSAAVYLQAFDVQIAAVSYAHDRQAVGGSNEVSPGEAPEPAGNIQIPDYALR